MPTPLVCFSFLVDIAHSGIRLDTFLSDQVQDCSRSFAAVLIRQGRITVDGKIRKPGYTVKTGETVSGSLPPPSPSDFSPEAIPLSILYEDQDLLVVNKMPGMVVHPSPGHTGGTLVNALMHHCPDLKGISGSLRPGIVHRLDKDTSGVLVVAKTERAMLKLTDQFKGRKVKKQYLALVYGSPELDSGMIDFPIGRHPVERKQMSINSRTPRSALTFWRVKNRFSGATLLEVDIHTGRTHQIRVHCQAMGHPIIGDPLYHGRNREIERRMVQISIEAYRKASSISRQMLHAWKLQIEHPADDRIIRACAPLPSDMEDLIQWFSKHYSL